MRADENDRVRAHTDPEVMANIDHEIEERIHFYAGQTRGRISARIEELEREWDVERWIEVNAPLVAGTGLILGTFKNKKWYLLTGGVLAFLFQHALQGWCPPVPILRRAGVRTRGEIDREKFALKALRGDFDRLPESNPRNQLARAAEALRAVSA